MKRLLSLTTICICVFLNTETSFGQEVSKQSSIVGQYYKLLDTITVTATRNPIKSYEYPGMVSVIDNDGNLIRQSSTVDDFLKLIPNVEFSGGPRRTGETPNIRGVNGADVVILLDGARQNFGSAHDGRFFIDPSLIKQAEILRGPASSLYGSGGLGGVIEFRTIDPNDILKTKDKIATRISTAYENVNEELATTAVVAARPMEKLQLLTSITKRSSGAIELGNGTTLSNSEDDILNGIVKAKLQINSSHRIEGSFIGFNNDATEPDNGQGLGGDDSVDKEIRSNTSRFSYHYNEPSNDIFDLDLITYYQEFKADELRLDSLGPGDIGDTVKRDVTTYGMRVDNRSRLKMFQNETTLVTYGFEFYKDEQDGADGTGERNGVPDAESEFFGSFIQAEFSVNDPYKLIPGEFLIIPGGRFDDYKTSSSLSGDNDDNHFSPKLGLTYLPNDWLMIFGNYAEAFRAPTYNELYLTGTHFAIPLGRGTTIINRFVPNPNLKPQETETFEFGFGIEFNDLAGKNDLFQLKASHFRSVMNDYINLSVTQPTPFRSCSPFIRGNCDGTTNSDNIPNASLWGTEIEANYENSRLVLGLGFSSINGKNDDTGAKLGSLSPDQLSFNIGVKIPELQSVIGWRGIAAAEFENVDDEDDKRSGYTVHDVYLSWEPNNFLIDGVRLDLGVDNAFDKSYSRVSTSAAEPGRNIKGLITYSRNW